MAGRGKNASPGWVCAGDSRYAFQAVVKSTPRREQSLAWELLNTFEKK